MRIVEYQSKRLCGSFGIPIPKSKLIFNSDSLKNNLSDFHFPLVLKAQVDITNRGKYGGICLAKNISEANDLILKMFLTKMLDQSVTKILIEELIEFKVGYTITLFTDQTSNEIILNGSNSISPNEYKNKKEKPESDIFQYRINPFLGFTKALVGELAIALGIEAKKYDEFSKIIFALWELFNKFDANYIELSPLVLDNNNNFYVLGVQINFDDSALFRQKEICELIQRNGLNKKQKFQRLGVDYLSNSGDISIIGNDLDHCMTISDVFLDEGIHSGDLLGMGEFLSPTKIEYVLDSVNEDTRSKIIYVNLICEQYNFHHLIEGIRNYFTNYQGSQLFIVRLNDGETMKFLNEEIHTKNVFIVKHLQEALTMIKKIIGENA